MKKILIFVFLMSFLILCVACTAEKNSLTGQDVVDILVQRGCNDGIIHSLKYSMNGVAYGEDQMVNISSGVVLSKILPLLEEVPASSIVFKRYTLGILIPHTHTIFFQNHEFPIFSADYSIESNELVFVYSEVFTDTPVSSPLQTKAIVMKMDQTFPTVILGISGPDIRNE